jgi:hypothetical protein
MALLASTMHVLSNDYARALVDQLLGPPDDWISELMRYRLSAEFQADFKAEWGHWLHTAGHHGFQEEVVKKVLDRAKPLGSEIRDPNDKASLVLAQEMAPAMFAHYLCGTGWTFGGWEWEHNGGSVGDVDLRLGAPDGTTTWFQVKSSDQPGYVVNHRIAEGEYDDRIDAALDKAAKQLPKTETEAKFIALSANRSWPLSLTPQRLVADLIGSTATLDFGPTILPTARVGKFAAPEWRHVSGVIILDYVRGPSPTYGCVVLLNPWATVLGSAAWFPHGQVAVLEDERFRWVGGAPEDSTLPNGTRLMDYSV